MMVAVKQGVPEALGMNAQDWANKYLGGYIKMEAGQRREVIKEMVNDGMTQRQISDVLGVHQTTVSEDLRSDGNPSKANGDKPDSDESPSETKKKCAVDLELKEQAEEVRQRLVATRLFGQLIVYLDPRSMTAVERTEQTLCTRFNYLGPTTLRMRNPIMGWPLIRKRRLVTTHNPPTVG